MFKIFGSNFSKLCLESLTLPLVLPTRVHNRNYATPKRFYKNTNVLFCDGKYEITLDHRKLKTPNGTIFTVDSEPLAIAVATEWDSQKDIINSSTMHLTALCNTTIDNPNKLTKLDLVNYLINYLPTDTILFQSTEDDDLYELQKKEWDPILKWFNDRYETDLTKSRSISTPSISAVTKMNISKYLMSYNEASLHGFVYAVDTLKSIILSCACIDRYLTTEKAVLFCRLEEEFQLGYWGRVEWAHDLNQQELQSRLAAAILFIHFNSSNTIIKEKLIV